MRADKKKAAPLLTLVNIPPEITCMILAHLSAKDFVSLRRVSKSFNRYFTSDNISHYAHRLFFRHSTELTGAKPYPAFPQRKFDGGRTRLFDNVYQRTRNWKLGQPTEVEVIEEVTDGSAGCSGSLIVSPEDGLLIYQKARGTLVLRDLNRPLPQGAQSETVINLQDVLGDCIILRTQGLLRRDGESIWLRLNRGMLLVVGEAHVHPLNSPPNGRPSAREENGWGSTLWNWTPWATNPTSPQQTQRHIVLHPPHTLCAVFSVLPQNRGQLIQKWHEGDFYMSMAALNEHYCITEFHILQQRLEGVIFAKEDATSAGNGSRSLEPAHRFTVRIKTTYPQLSTFDIAPDTKGKVFYLGFLPPPDRRPVVEVYTVPQQNECGIWLEPTVIKRVVLRTLAKHLESTGGALHRSYWIDFDDGFEVTEHTRCGSKERAHWKLGEDVVRLCLRGDFAIPGTTNANEVVKLVSWYVTARPSPEEPSSIEEWRAGRPWKKEELNNHERRLSPWADAQGHVDLEECYPSPTYYTSPSALQKLLEMLPRLPEDVDPDPVHLYEYPVHVWQKDESDRNKYLCALYYAESAVYSASQPQGLISALHHEQEFEDIDIEYPAVPGIDDHDFVPPGKHLHAKYIIPLETGRTVKNKQVWDRLLSESRAAGKKSARGRTFVQALQECHSLAHGEDEEEDGQRKNQAVKAHALKSGFKYESQLLMPGQDNAGLRGSFDWRNKRFLVYAKCGANPRNHGAGGDTGQGKKGVERDSDKIVIVRFDRD